QAKTGTGKTFAFAIPVVEHLDYREPVVQAVVIVPTRELCKQVYRAFRSITKYQKLKITEVYGGTSINRQIHQLRSGTQIVIATPGRLIDLYERGELSFKHVKFIILDEADQMFDMGFLPDIRYILQEAMRVVNPRLFLFSATLLESIKELAHQFTNGEEIVEINVSHDSLVVDNCDQFYYIIERDQDKYFEFIKILQQEKPPSSIIFVKTKKRAESLYRRLKKEKKLYLDIAMLQGDMSQYKREQVFNSFKNQKINCLVATNIASRGLDFPQVSHVFNYDMPDTEESYVHRIGRTSRMARAGTAISICLSNKYHIISRIERFMNREIKERTLSDRPNRSQSGATRRDYGPRHVDSTVPVM
ncbi:MAG: DEAD/DEAH box helicase, partial [Candidatus Ranarchaeia archaeon]